MAAKWSLKMKPQQEEVLTKALLSLVDTQPAEGYPRGVIEFAQPELLQFTGEVIRNQSYISNMLNQLQAEGKIRNVRKGSHAARSQWDVRPLMGESKFEVAEEKQEYPQDKPEVSIAVVSNEEYNEPSLTTDQTIVVLKDSIKEMTSYLQLLPNQMTAYLDNLTKNLESGNPEEVQQLQDQINTLQSQLEQSIKDHEKLALELAFKEKQLQQRKEVHLNKNAVIRYKHHIMDDIERFIAAGGWQRENMKDSFRLNVNQKLNNIMAEIGIGESHDN